MSEPDQAPQDSHASDDSVPVPHAALDPETLRAVVESFVLREGTDYGAREFPLADKVEHVMRQLRAGEAQIVFDPVSESVTIVPTTDARGAPGRGTSRPPA